MLTQAHANANDFTASTRKGSEHMKPQNLQALIGGATRLEALLMVMTRAMLQQQPIDTRAANVFGGFMVTERMLAMYKKKG